MGRMDFYPTQEGFEEFKKYVNKYLKTNKMKLLIIGGKDAILRSNLSTNYDSAYIKNLSGEQMKTLETLVGKDIETWHISRFFWDEQTKIKENE